MSLTWGDYRTKIRRSILKDPNAKTWTNDVLSDICQWAQDTFCAHTALPTSYTYTSTARQLDLPDNVFSEIEKTGKLFFIADEDGTVNVVPPLYNLDTQDVQNLAYTAWNNQITFNATPDAGKIVLLYFAHYPAPVSDSDLILLPRWSLNAVSHLIGALAHTPEAVQSAGIDRWKTREDAGYPDDNALRAQQQWMLKVYDNELHRYPQQMRENFYNRVVIDSG